MTWFEQLEIHLRDLYLNNLSYAVDAFKPIFRTFFSEEHQTFRLKMFHNLDQLRLQLERENLHEFNAKTCLEVLQTQFKEFFTSKGVNSSDHLNQCWHQDFKEYTLYEPDTYICSLLENLDTLEAVIRRAVITYVDDSLIVSKSSWIESKNNNALSKSVNETQLKQHESLVTKSTTLEANLNTDVKALDVGSVITESSGLKSDKHDTSRSLGNYITHVVDADIRPVNDQVPFAEITLGVLVPFRTPSTLFARLVRNVSLMQIMMMYNKDSERGQSFSLNNSPAVHEKPHTPRSCLRWKLTGRIFKIAGLRWIPTRKMFTDNTTKIDSEPPNGSNDDITNPYGCDQTLNVNVDNTSGPAPQRKEKCTIQCALSSKEEKSSCSSEGSGIISEVLDEPKDNSEKQAGNVQTSLTLSSAKLEIQSMMDVPIHQEGPAVQRTPLIDTVILMVTDKIASTPTPPTTQAQVQMCSTSCWKDSSRKSRKLYTRVIKILIAIAVYYDYEIWQMDFKTAFLNGHLTQEVYMVQLEGFINPKFPNRVCKLQRSIYGLKQLSRQWNKRLDEKIKKFGFTQNRDEPCVYVKASGSMVTFLTLHIDDILITGNHFPMLQDAKSYLGKCFAIKDLEEAAYILGIKIYKDRSRWLYGLCQSAYIKKNIEIFNMENSKSGNIPMQEKPISSKAQGASTPAEELRVTCYIDVGYQTYADDSKS
uniref:Putative retrotransposon protein n=1 Tax=Tanacetum cinerariifolium TaxID=118510 RepID=A0A699GP38_TANCI|nr:putative retrotransposon protein [Tanacetum cinerariifolium]